MFKKIIINLIMIFIIMMPIVVNAKPSLDLEKNLTVQPGEVAKFPVIAKFDIKLDNKITQFSFDVVIDGEIDGKITFESTTGSTSNWFTTSGGNVGQFISKSTDGKSLVVSGDTILYLNIPIKKDSSEEMIHVTITNVKITYPVLGPVDEVTSSSSIIDETIDGNGSVKSITVQKKIQSSVAQLNSLITTQGELTPMFDPKTNEYNIVVKDTINKLTLEATCKDKCSLINGNTNFEWKKAFVLAMGENEPIEIRVTSEDVTNVEKYIVNIFRGSVSEEKVDLKSLSITDFVLDPVFSSNVYNYYIVVPNEVADLNIEYELNDPTSKIEVFGDKDLLIGEENAVKIVVTSEDGKMEHTYTIYTTRQDNTSSSSIAEEIVVDSKDSKNNTRKYILIGLIILISIGIIGAAFYFLFKKHKAKKNINNNLDETIAKDDLVATISHDQDSELLEYTKEYTDLVTDVEIETKKEESNNPNDYGKF